MYDQVQTSVYGPAGESDESEMQSISAPYDEIPGLSVEGLLRGVFGGDPIMMILDTGGWQSLLSHEVWHRNGCAPLDTVTPKPQVRNSDGQELEVCGRVRVPLVFKGMVYAVKFWVVLKMDNRIILGADFLRTHQAVIDMSVMRLYMNNLPQGVAMVLDRAI